MAKEKLTKRELFEEQGWRFNVYGPTGHVETQETPIEENEDILLPTQFNGKKKDYAPRAFDLKEAEHDQREAQRPEFVKERRPVRGDEVEPLLPAGVELEDR